MIRLHSREYDSRQSAVQSQHVEYNPSS